MSCTASCGGGIRRRERFCNNPRPAHGGKLCPGSELDEESCSEEPCAGITFIIMNLIMIHVYSVFLTYSVNEHNYIFRGHMKNSYVPVFLCF